MDLARSRSTCRIAASRSPALESKMYHALTRVLTFMADFETRHTDLDT